MSFWTATVVIVAIVAGTFISMAKQKTQRGNNESSSKTDALEKEIETLKARIETLEKIVTDPSYDLKREFENLKDDKSA